MTATRRLEQEIDELLHYEEGKLALGQKPGRSINDTRLAARIFKVMTLHDKTEMNVEELADRVQQNLDRVHRFLKKHPERYRY